MIEKLNKEETTIKKKATDVMERYCLTTDNFPREVVLLKSKFCTHRKCSFCDYWADGTNDIEEMKRVAEEQLAKVTGETGVLEIINSGSFQEIPFVIIQMIREVIREKKIHTMMFEAHFKFRDQMDEVYAMFQGIKLIPKTGVETFNYEFRELFLRKGFTEATSPEIVAKYFKAVNLLVGIKGQTIEMVAYDIEQGLKHFDYILINIFTENARKIEIDYELIEEFYKRYEHLRENKKVLLYDHKNAVGLG